MTTEPEDVSNSTPETIGHAVSKIPVELSTRFLEHFSEQLYSSPQKAFEELISNGWDAGAEAVDVRISDDLKVPGATMAVLDNGSSMDEPGLRALWHIAFSPKRDNPVHHGRHVVGKFGIGKLATYVLAEKLTYICKAADGVIRRVTMDYGKIDSQKGADADRLISELELDVFETDEAEVAEALSAVAGGNELLEQIKLGFPTEKASGKASDDQPPSEDFGIKLAHDSSEADGESSKVDGEESETENEFGGAAAVLVRPRVSTWTLVILSNLKPTGQGMKLGVLRRMLKAALPFESEMVIRVNGERLSSSKLNATLTKQWVIGPALDIDYVELDDGEEGQRDDDQAGGAGDAASSKAKPKPTRIPVKSGLAPYPYVELPEIGRVTGMTRLFEEKISGGKSEERGASNGFHVNVLGRVVNQGDPSFGEENLSHAAWARFRMTVRADGLNEYLTTNREQFKERRGLKIFRAFLRRAFNKARTTYDSDHNVEMPDGGDVLVRSLGVLSLSPLRGVVSETLRTQPPLLGLFDETGISDREATRSSWRENTADNIKNALGQVKYEKIADDSFVKFRINDSTIVVNKDHPFVVEHSRTKAEKELVRTVAMVSLLADVYALDLGIEPAMLENIRTYRDKLMRFRSLQRRQSGVHIARLLLQTQHQSDFSKRLEAVVSDALRYLGFDVRDLAQSGEPEGIASAFPSPTQGNPTEDNPTPPLYSFSFDAKSSKKDVAKTGNISLDAVAEHRDRYSADHALVIAPGFSDGALAVRCEQQKITPMTAYDLGRLLEYTVEYGAIPVTKFREVLLLNHPAQVTAWVDALGDVMKSQRTLTIDIFLRALDVLKGKVPDVLSASTIALTCRQELKVVSVKEADVIALVRGLQIIVPDLVGISEDKIVVNASAQRVAAAVEAQLEKLHEDVPPYDGSAGQAQPT